ncbi:MAG: response regulator [Proteobacteria bacterium]|nr:response regulator [Pseudomonadota bacterium]
MAIENNIQNSTCSTTILVVDDLQNNLKVFKGFIKSSFRDHRVLTTTDPMEGLKMAADYKPDAILLDYQMPGMDGINFCRTLKADRTLKNIPVLLITGHMITPKLKADGLEAGASDFLVKPIDMVEFTAKIRVVLRTKRLEDELKQANRNLRQEVAHRKEVETTLRESEGKFREFVEATDNLITQVDSDGRFLYVNHMSHPVLGVTPDECRGLSVIDFIHPEDKERVAGVFGEWTTGRCRNGSLENRFVNKANEKERHLISTVNLKYDSSGNLAHINAITQDITAFKNAEAELVFARNQAEAVNESMKNLVSMVSHEIRNPLHHIINFARFGLNKTGIESSDTIRDFFNTILESGNGLLALLNDLLDLSKLESGKMNYQMMDTRLEKIVASSIMECSSTAEERGVSLEMVDPDESVNLNCDPQKIKQVMQNLLSNAIRFSPAGKTVTVSLASERLPLGRRKTDSETTAALSVAVKDEGLGIPENELSSIFEKFNQSSANGRNGGGTGLGLTICREIIKAHNGKIWAENNPEGGTTFRFVLPIVRSIGDTE